MASVEAARALAGVTGAAGRAGDMAADAVRLRELSGTSYTPSDAQRLRQLVESGPPELTAGLPRRASNGAELDDQLADVISPQNDWVRERAGNEVEQFLAAWRYDAMTEAERASELRRLRDLPAADYGVDDWKSLASALAVAPPHTMPRILPGMKEPISAHAWGGARGSAHADSVQALQRVQDAWRVAEMSADEVRVAADRLRNMPATEYTPRDWSLLDALRGSGVYASRIDMPATVWGTTEFDRLIRYYRTGEWTKPEREMMRYMSAWRATALTDDELLEATKALVARDPATFVRDDWRALRALLDANDMRGDVLRHPTEPKTQHAPTFRQFVAYQEDEIVRYHPDALRHHFATWMQRLDRTWEARAREAMHDAAAGRPATFEPNMPTAIANFDDAEMWNLTGREQVRLGVALLRNGELSTSKVVDTPLLLLDEGLDEVGELAPQLQQLRDDTKGLVEHNLAVIDGRTPGNGYRNEPDYAHVGRITANAELIERAISTPQVVAPPRVDPDAAKLADTLSW